MISALFIFMLKIIKYTVFNQKFDKCGKQNKRDNKREVDI